MYSIIGLGLLLIAIGTWLTIMGQLKINNQKSEQIKELTQENIELNKELSIISKETAAIVTGGDSYCYFFISGPNKSNVCDLLLLTKGEYPLYDVSIRIDDVEKMLNHVKKMKKPYDTITEANENLFQYSILKTIGNLAPNQNVHLGSILFSQKEKQSYNIYINARNGVVNQLFRFRKLDNKWKRAERITVNGDIIKETIDSEFPKKQDEKSIW